jgi:hypothetical protein
LFAATWPDQHFRLPGELKDEREEFGILPEYFGPENG